MTELPNPPEFSHSRVVGTASDLTQQTGQVFFKISRTFIQALIQFTSFLINWSISTLSNINWSSLSEIIISAIVNFIPTVVSVYGDLKEGVEYLIQTTPELVQHVKRGFGEFGGFIKWVCHVVRQELVDGLKKFEITVANSRIVVNKWTDQINGWKREVFFILNLVKQWVFVTLENLHWKTNYFIESSQRFFEYVIIPSADQFLSFTRQTWLNLGSFCSWIHDFSTEIESTLKLAHRYSKGSNMFFKFVAENLPFTPRKITSSTFKFAFSDIWYFCKFINTVPVIAVTVLGKYFLGLTETWFIAVQKKITKFKKIIIRAKTSMLNKASTRYFSRKCVVPTSDQDTCHDAPSASAHNAAGGGRSSNDPLHTFLDMFKVIFGYRSLSNLKLCRRLRRWMRTKRITVSIARVRYGEQRISPGHCKDVVAKVREILIASGNRSSEIRKFYDELSSKVYVRQAAFEVDGKDVEVYFTEHGNEELWMLKLFAREQLLSEISVWQIDDKTDNKKVISNMIKEVKLIGYYDNPTLSNINEAKIYNELDELFQSHKQMAKSLKGEGGTWMYGQSFTEKLVLSRTGDFGRELMKIPDGFLVNDGYSGRKFEPGWNGALIMDPNPIPALYDVSFSLVFIVLSVFGLSVIAVFYTETY